MTLKELDERSPELLSAEPPKNRNPFLPTAYCLLPTLFLPALLALMLIPIWSFHYFPSTDGGAHVANADVLLHYFRADGAAYRTFYQLNLRPIPNTAGHLALAALLAIFPPAAAEKALVSLIVILFPLSLRYAVRSIHRGSGYLAWLALPLSLSWILHQGFYNFCLGVCAFFLLLGYWIRHRDHLTIRRAIVLAGISLLVYACHLFTILMGCLAIGLLGAWLTGVDAVAACMRGEREAAQIWRALWPAIRTRFVITFAALSPAMLLAAKFRFMGRPEAAVRHTAWFSLPYWKNLCGIGILFSYRQPEIKVAEALAALLFIVIAGLIIWKLFRRRFSPYDGLLLFVGGLTLLYFTKADVASEAIFLPQRLILFIWLGLILWIAGQPVGWWRQRILQTGAAAAALALSVLHFQSYRAMNVQIEEFVATGNQIAPGSTMLPLVFNPCGVPEVCDTRLHRPSIVPFYTAAGYAAASRRAIDLRNYEAGLDYFPVRFRDAVNPYEKLIRPGDKKALDAIPQRVDIPHYRERTGGRASVDYVLFFAAPSFLDPKLREHPDTREIERQLADGFDLIHTSTRGAAQLWRRKDWGLSSHE